MMHETRKGTFSNIRSTKSKINLRIREMDLNPGKCQIMHISISRDPLIHSYILYGQVRQAVDHAKYLELEISSEFSWNTHIQNVTAKANRTWASKDEIFAPKKKQNNNNKKNKTSRHTRDCLQHFDQARSRVCLPCVEPIYPVQHK